MTKKNVLIFCDYYLPGFKAGGPIRSIQSICEALGDTFNIYLVTRDRDLGSRKSYINIEHGKWKKVGRVNVFYIKEEMLSLKLIKEIIIEIQPTVIHLNSLLSIRYSLMPLICTRLFFGNHIKVLLSPRGELSDGALNLNKYKKRIYIFALKFFKLTKFVEWIASSQVEFNDVNYKLSVKQDKIHLIDNLPNISQWKIKLERTRPKEEHSLDIVFFSRIARMKNLHYVLILFREINFPVNFHIYGPVEDEAYYIECKKIIRELPSFVSIKFMGHLQAENVYEIIKEYDLFLLPTLGENFGQAIWEALASSVPVLISDNTPWKNLEHENIGCDVSLENHEQFLKYIKSIYQLTESEHQKMRSKCRDYALNYVENSDAIESLMHQYQK